MAEGVNIGSAYFDIRAEQGQLKSDFEKAKASSKKAIDDMNTQLSKIKLSADASVLKMKFEEAVKWQNDLRAKLEKQIKMNMDVGTIQKTKAALDSVSGSLSGMKKEVSETASIWDKIKGFAAGLGLVYGAQQLVTFGKEAINVSAELEVLRSNFKGTEEDIQLFRIATAGTVTDANLIKLSNQASDLGISLTQQAIFFSLAEDAADKYGGGVEEGMSKVILATEGSSRALKSLGIQKKIFEEIVKDLTQEFARQGRELDAESIKQIRIEALIRATGITIEDVKNKVRDSKDEIESWGVAWEKIKTDTGSVILPILFGIRDAFKEIFDAADKAGNAIDKALKFKSPVFGPGEETKASPEAEQNKQDLESALSAKRFIAKDGSIKEFIVEWKTAGKTVEEIQLHIQTLQAVQKTLIPGTVEYKNNVREIRDLTKLTSDNELANKQKAEEAERKRQTAISQYLDLLLKMGMLDQQYFSNKFKLIDEEVARIKKEGGDEVDAVKYKAAKIKEVAEDLYKFLKDKLKIDFSPEGLKGFKANLSGEFGSQLIKATPKKDTVGKPSILGSDTSSPAESFEAWVRGSEAASIAMDTFIDGAMTGMSLLRIRISDTATEAERAFADFGNRTLQIIESIIAKWAVLNLFSMLAGGGGINLFSMLGLKEGGYAMNGAKIPSFAGGVGSYMVPNGFPNDSFPVMVQSGEDLRVRTPQQRAMAEMDNKAVANAINGLNKAIRNINSGSDEQTFTIYNQLDGETIAINVTKHQNRMMRRGKNLSEIS